MRDLGTFLAETRAEIHQGDVATSTVRKLCDELDHRQRQERLLVEAYELTLELLEDTLRELESVADREEVVAAVARLSARVANVRLQAAKIREFIG